MRLNASDVPAVDKLWGVTRCVFKDDTHEVWHASPKAGGYSSRHRHLHMPNKFYVVSGKLHVELYAQKPGPGIDPLCIVTLTAGQEYTVPEGDWHRFVAGTDVELVEVYWTHIKTEGYIERTDLGGVLSFTDNL